MLEPLQRIEIHSEKYKHYYTVKLEVRPRRTKHCFIFQIIRDLLFTSIGFLFKNIYIYIGNTVYEEQISQSTDSLSTTTEATEREIIAAKLLDPCF